MEPSDFIGDLKKLKRLALWDEIAALWQQTRIPLAHNLLAACERSSDPLVRAALAAYRADGLIMGFLRTVDRSAPKVKVAVKPDLLKEFPDFEDPMNIAMGERSLMGDDHA